MGAYRELLQNLGVNVLPTGVAVGGAFKAFGDDGDLKDPKMLGMLDAAMTHLVDVARSEANRDVACDLLAKLKTTAASGEYGAVP